MTLRELIDAIDREAERALVGYPLDLDTPIEVRQHVRRPSNYGHGKYEEVETFTRVARLERVGGRVFLVLE